MSISRRVTDSQEELIIRNEPQITEAVLGALIELLKAIPDVSDLQATLVQMETICVKSPQMSLRSGRKSKSSSCSCTSFSARSGSGRVGIR
ncbi:hypothetical protein ACMA1I_22980 [Pontibacter sp. 13R65]|uniref:hypothetical protein n=1 Tax=Pontibacter sp. 13R65 TaxID=3127458 RepID=UPI00301B806A